MKILKARVVSAAIACTVLLLLFLFSGQTGKVSNGFSKSLAEQILLLLHREYTNDDLLLYNLLLRKLAHFTLFSCLGIGLSGVLAGDRPIRTFSRVFFLGVAFAVLDESHQLFVHARTASFRDVLLDSCGTVAGYGFYRITGALANRVSKRVDIC